MTSVVRGRTDRRHNFSKRCEVASKNSADHESEERKTWSLFIKASHLFFQLKTGDSHLLKVKNFSGDFAETFLKPLKANPVNDLIIYLDIFHKRSKMQYLDLAHEPPILAGIQVTT